MKLLEAIEILNVNDERAIQAIVDCLNERIEKLEFSSLINGNNSKTDEKIYELGSIVEDIENMKSLSMDKKEKVLKLIRRDLKYYQFEYGGLKRLTI